VVRRWRDLSVGRKVVGPYIVLTLLVGLLISAVASQQLANASAQQTSVVAVREEDAVNMVINLLEERQLSELRLLTATTGVATAVRTADRTSLTKLLLPLISNQLPEQLRVAVINGAGDQILTLEADPTKPSECVCAPQVRRVPYLHLGDVLAGMADQHGTRYLALSEVDGSSLLYTIGPLIDSDGYLAGAVVVGERIDQALSLLQQRAPIALALFSRSGSLLGTAGLTFTMPEIGAADRIAAMSGRTAVVRHVSNGGRQVEVFYVPWTMRFETLGYVGLVVPADPIKGAQTLLVFVILGICVAALVLTVAVGGIVSRSITRPMEGLIKATGEVAKGHLDYRANVEASDEIGRLTASFNQMVGVLAERTAQVQRLSDETVRALAAAIDARDPYTHGHSIRVAAYSQVLARSSGLDDGHVEAIRRGCLVHDIGKIGIRDTILLKQGQLSPTELAEMREHPAVGYKMLQRLEWDQRVFDVVLHHHEKWDGSGYPYGLVADGVPVVARVVAIADALDAMTSQRPYRSALSYSEAIDEIVRQAGVQFDPVLVKAFRAVRREIGRLVKTLGSTASIASEGNRSSTPIGQLVKLPVVS
jgi:putative nucleotidyltransferase with HDIG domain